MLHLTLCFWFLSHASHLVTTTSDMGLSWISTCSLLVLSRGEHSLRAWNPHLTVLRIRFCRLRRGYQVEMVGEWISFGCIDGSVEPWHYVQEHILENKVDQHIQALWRNLLFQTHSTIESSSFAWDPWLSQCSLAREFDLRTTTTSMALFDKDGSIRSALPILDVFHLVGSSECRMSGCYHSRGSLARSLNLTVASVAYNRVGGFEAVSSTIFEVYTNEKFAYLTTSKRPCLLV